MASDFNWPKPYLLKLYARAVQEGCVRVPMHRGGDAEFRSLKAAFYRLRRRKDGDFLINMRPEYQLVTVRFEPALSTALFIYDKLPDSEELPPIISISEDQKETFVEPATVQPPEEPVEDFDATAHVAGLIDKIDLEDDDGNDATELD